MVHSPNYEKLQVFLRFAEANAHLEQWETDHAEAEQGFNDAVKRLKEYRDGHGFTGKAADAMNKWVDRSIERIEGYRTQYTRGHSAYKSARASMAAALEEGRAISPALIDAKTEAMRDDPIVGVPASEPGGGVSVLGMRFTSGAAYVEAVEIEANEQREAACRRILNMVNGKTKLFASLMDVFQTGEAKDPREQYNLRDDESSGGGSGSNHSTGGGSVPPWDYSKENGYGREAARSGTDGTYPGNFDKPWWSEADAAAARNRVIASGAVPTKELPYGELGSRTNPITNPQDLMDTDLLHTRVNGTTYRNGVVGGHTPAPPADAQHPLWRLNGGAAADAATAGRLGGAGVLGAGALGMRGAARMGSGSGFGGLGSTARMGSGFGGASGSAGGMGGLRGITGTTGSAGAMGASNLRVGTYSGSGFGSYTPPASVAGANGAAGAGASGVTGTTGAGGSAAGAAGAAGRGGAGTGGGFMGGGAGAGAGMGKDDKKGRKRKYVAFTVDEDEDDLPAGYVNPLSQTYGTDRTIAPVKREDDGWDLRQW